MALVAIGTLRDNPVLTVIAMVGLVVFTTFQAFSVFAAIVEGAWLFLVLGLIFLATGFLFDRARREIAASLEDASDTPRKEQDDEQARHPRGRGRRQAALVGVAVAPQLSARVTGDTYLFRVAPLDPIDPFRGAYVTLDYPDLQTDRSTARRLGRGQDRCTSRWSRRAA